MKNGFFNVLSVQEFIARLKIFPPLEDETVPLDEADGRILYRDVVSQENLPLASRSCMDGYALNARDIFGASESNPAYLESIGDVDIESPASFTVQPGQCASIVTGGILPDGTDAVVMVEHTEELGSGTVEIRKSLAPNDNVMLKGEDAATGSVALAASTMLRPQEVGLLAAIGVTSVPVHRRPRVGIISTGDELIPVEEAPRVGQVRDVNSITLACCARRAGAEPTCYGLVPDNLNALEAALRKAAAENDVIFLSGGSSVGTRDLTVAAIGNLENAELINHGVAISPGKPLILARQNNTAIWGLPGQVASAQVVMFVLGAPFLRYLQGHTGTDTSGNTGGAFSQATWPARRATLARNVASKQGREDYVRIRLVAAEAGEELPKAVPVLGKSGLLKTMTASHGVIRIPADSEGLYAGDDVDVLLYT